MVVYILDTTMAMATTTTYITIDSHKRASSKTCDEVYCLNRTLQGVQWMRLSNMQFYNTIYKLPSLACHYTI